MSNLAQEEADRFFNYKPSATSHPEDANGDPALDSDEDQPRRGIKSSRKSDPEDQDTDDEDFTQRESALSGTKQSYIVPSTAQYANTGPKGVIADAQNYHRTKHNGSRKSQHNIGQTPSEPYPSTTQNGNTSDSDIDLEDDEENDPFMQQWREKRLVELQEQYTSHPSSSSTTHDPTRTWGTLEHVNATGYLSAIETTPPPTHVIVFIFDPLNADSLEVEDELKMLAYTWPKTRFVKMHHRIAEMQSVEIPAVLVYKGGEVVVTMSAVRAEGVEGVLMGQGILVK